MSAVTENGSPRLKIGFVGLGIMGAPMAKNLIKAGHNLVVWNRSPAKCDDLVNMGAIRAKSPAAVVQECGVTIAMLADPSAALNVVLGDEGVIHGLTPGKAYVDMSTVDAATSAQIGEAVLSKGGRFLEAPVSGSKKPAEDGTLIIMAAGDEGLFREVEGAFNAMAKKSFFLGPVGSAAKMKLIVNMIMGSMTVAFSEGMGLAEKSNLSQDTLLSILGLGALANPLFQLKGQSIIKGVHKPAAFPLKHQQKDMRLALALAAEVQQPLSVATAANEAFVNALAMGFDDSDMSAVYEAVASSPPPK